MFSARNIKYDLENLTNQVTEITNKKTEIENAKNDLIKALEQIRMDWVSEGGTEFFNLVDQDWQKEVEKCINVLSDLIDALNATIKKYGEIETEASNNLKF